MTERKFINVDELVPQVAVEQAAAYYGVETGRFTGPVKKSAPVASWPKSSTADARTKLHWFAERAKNPWKTAGFATSCNTEPNGANEKSGWGGIRTPGRVATSAVFKTAALVHSATHPVEALRLQEAEKIALKRRSRFVKL